MHHRVGGHGVRQALSESPYELFCGSRAVRFLAETPDQGRGGVDVSNRSLSVPRGTM